MAIRVWARTLAIASMVLVIATTAAFAAGTEEESEVTPENLVVVGHRVHQNIITGATGSGRDLAAEFVAANDDVSGVEFITMGVSEVRDRLFREATLSSTDVAVGFVYSPWITPDMPNFFLSLNELAAELPLEDVDDIFANLREELTYDGQLYGVPLRASGQGLFYNKTILAEAGIDAPPETVEELIEQILQATFTRENGEQVYGLAKHGVKEEVPFVVGQFMRAKNGDWVSSDFDLRVTDPEALWAISVFADFYEAGALPSNFTSVTNQDTIELFKANRAAFTVAGPGYLANYTGEGGLDPADVGFINFPPSEEIADEWPAAPTVTFQWAMVIPKNAPDPEASWRFIQSVTTKDSILSTVLSGNEPVRSSTFSNSQYLANAAFPEAQERIFEYGRPLFPGFDNFPQFRDILGEAIQQAVIGQSTPEAAMASVEQRLQDLLPQ